MLSQPNHMKAVPGIEVPKELYWVLEVPAPLAGMQYPRPSFPWATLYQAGFNHLVSLQPGPFDPAPLSILFRELLQDLVSGGPPRNEDEETSKIARAVKATVGALRTGQGVVVHCVGGRGRTGTVLGCVLREFGIGADDAIAFLDQAHKSRGKVGWPESSWQAVLVRGWRPDVR
jgi:hypothetical protein